MIDRSTPAALLALVAALLLAACGGAAGDDDAVLPLDPAVSRALSAPLMTDPDLTSVNEANAALTGAADHSLPLLPGHDEAVRQANDRALALVGAAGALPELPEPAELEPEPVGSPLVLLEETVAQVKGGKACLGGARYSTVWAARLPKALPVFPRGGATEALGQDGKTCQLRAVRFMSPVAAEDIARFYFRMADKADLAPQYRANGESWEISGAGKGAIYLVRGRPALQSGQEIDLVTLGL